MTAKPPRRDGPPEALHTAKLDSPESTRPAVQPQRDSTPPEIRRPTPSARAAFYAPVPHALGEADSRHALSLPVWRIELHDLLPHAAVGYDILGDALIGRSCPGCAAPDIDLAAFKGRVGAVSRRHAMLRPTPHTLYLIDLGSTNGSRVNSARLTPGAAITLSQVSTITLGILTFTLKIVATPQGAP